MGKQYVKSIHISVYPFICTSSYQGEDSFWNIVTGNSWSSRWVLGFGLTTRFVKTVCNESQTRRLGAERSGTSLSRYEIPPGE